MTFQVPPRVDGAGQHLFVAAIKKTFEENHRLRRLRDADVFKHFFGDLNELGLQGFPPTVNDKEKQDEIDHTANKHVQKHVHSLN